MMRLLWIRGAVVGAMALSLAVPTWALAANTKEVREKEEKAEQKAMDKEQIKSFQEALKAKGEDPGPIDGVIGHRTRSALRAFQKANDLTDTGILDDQTAEKLTAQKRGLLSDVSGATSSRFDFDEMAKVSLGTEWDRRTPKEQTEFVKLFADFFEKAVVSRTEPASNKITYPDDRVDESYAKVGSKLQGVFMPDVVWLAVDESYTKVGSKLQTPRGGEITINYMLRRLQSGWKIYDLIVEDVSMVKNYRAQFSCVISKSSYEELVHRINQKLSEFDGELAMAD
jgi:phospholipid transport system substrate-binding protein